MSIFNLPLDIKGQGSVTKASQPQPASAVQEEAPLQKSIKPEFDENMIADGRYDTSKDGGVSVARSTGINGISEKVTGDIYGFQQPDQKGQLFEVAGFRVSYAVRGTKDMAATSVRVYKKTLDEAKACFNGSQYTHTMNNGETMICQIIEGAPIICVEEAHKLSYIEGKWVRP